MRRAILALVALLLAPAAWAQSANSFPTTNPDQRAPLMLMGCLNASGQVVPCSTAAPLASQSAPAAAATGGLSTYRVNSPAGASGTVVKSSPGRLYAFDLCNTASATRYVRLYDSTTPTPGTTPVFAGAIAISAGSCQQFNTNVGLSFANGIGMGITSANGDSDTTPVTAGDITGFVGFQ